MIIFTSAMFGSICVTAVDLFRVRYLMIIDREYLSVQFEESDRPFVDRFGIDAAEEMVLNYAVFSNRPFLFDVYQLADFLGTDCHRLYALTNHCASHYRHFRIPKGNGGYRHLYAPNGTLKYIQRKILRGILNNYPISPYAMAYHQGASLYKNAEPHCKWILWIFSAASLFRPYTIRYSIHGISPWPSAPC